MKRTWLLVVSYALIVLLAYPAMAVRLDSSLQVAYVICSAIYSAIIVKKLSKRIELGYLGIIAWLLITLIFALPFFIEEKILYNKLWI